MTTESYDYCAIPAPLTPPNTDPPATTASLTRQLRAVLQWRDAVEEPEMIVGDSCDKKHLVFVDDPITEHEARGIADTANGFYRRMGSPRRVGVVKATTFQPWSEGDDGVAHLLQ